MIYLIFRNNIEIAKIKPDASSELVQKKQQEDYVKMNFTLNSFVGLQIGDYIKLEKNQQFYYLNKKPRVVESPSDYRYECIFEGRIHELRKTKIFLDTPKDVGFYRDYSFPLTGNAQTFLLFIVDNLNRNGASYQAGTFKTTETTTLDFNNWNAFEAINSISTELEFDWHIEGDVLNFDAKTAETSYVFQVGRKSGFRELTRARVENEIIETIVYGFGSTENMPPRTSEEGNTFNSSLLTENRLDFVGDDGLSNLSKNVSIYGSVESVQQFDNIKPEFTGVVSAIDENDIQSFFDTSIDFDINEQLLEGIFPKITFLSGKLIGITFNILYTLAEDKITMDFYSDESGEYPNELIFTEVGDTYKLFDLSMPETYVTDAQTRLQEATQAYLDKQSIPLDSYTGVVDREYIQSRGIVLNLGDLFRSISIPFGLDNVYAINELRQSITDIHKYSLTFGDVLPLGLLATLKVQNFKTENNIDNISRTSVTNNQVTNVIGDSVSWE